LKDVYILLTSTFVDMVWSSNWSVYYAHHSVTESCFD